MNELYEIPMPCRLCPLLQEKLERVEKSLRKKSKKRKLFLKDEMQGRESSEDVLDLVGIAL